KNFTAPQVLDAYAQVKFAEAFQLSAGSILLPLTRNGTQPTTTYLSIDNAFVDTTPILQGNTNVIRDLGVQLNGFLLGEQLEYRIGLFQGSRAAAIGVDGRGPRREAGHLHDLSRQRIAESEGRRRGGRLAAGRILRRRLLSRPAGQSGHVPERPAAVQPPRRGRVLQPYDEVLDL